jgi:hypothetical protein
MTSGHRHPVLAREGDPGNPYRALLRTHPGGGVEEIGADFGGYELTAERAAAIAEAHDRGGGWLDPGDVEDCLRARGLL